MKIWTSEHTFNHPWETVAQAAWRKYPNPMNPAVIGTDVVEREVVDGVLHTHRLVSSKWGLPSWVLRLIGPANICYASERSVVNPTEKVMTLKTRNLTFGRYVAVDEMVKYTPHPVDTNKTLLTQEAVVTVQGVPLNSYMEDLLTNTIMSNANKGRQAIEWVIDKIDKEVTEIRNNAVTARDELLTQTKRSIGDIKSTARRSMDGLSTAAINLTTKSPSTATSAAEMPKI
ncbi:PRELI-like family [Nesidiocoris tenuis]|uniref:PRELI-like family n=1 Tax=Nesidiocoris tenuis TaxID=355587 RepID=A0ABN7ACF5_9HEMI|nr:PRELI-like family [Nesidiocoris tenuis]